MEDKSLSIVTRTRDRPRFLERAAKALNSAAPSGSQWIVVDDSPKATDKAQLSAFLGSIAPNLKIKVVHCGGEGRSAAWNKGMKEVNGRYLHIHDDDDTVHPQFYQKLIGALEENPLYGAAIARVERITERTEGAEIREISRQPHNDLIPAVTFAQMAQGCIFPPIAFVARREAVLATGPADINLDECEDYDFFLRFLLHSDIKIVPEVLCFLHQRPDAEPGTGEANSPYVFGHYEREAIFRNNLMRRDFAENKMGLGTLLQMAEINSGNRRLDILLRRLARAPGLSLLKRWIIRR